MSEPPPSDAIPGAAPPSRTPAPSGSKRLVLGVVAIAVVLAAGWAVRVRSRGPTPGGSGGPQAAASADARPVPVSLATVEARDVPVVLEGLGSVTALATVSLRPQVDGRLDGVFFKEGQEVKKGQHLAQIDPRPFAIALRAAQAATARDRAQLDNAKVNLARFTSLAAQSLVPQQQVDDQRALVAQLAAVVASDETQGATARLNIDYARIVSPIDGVTGVRQIDPGNLVRASDATGIVVLTQLDPIAVVFTLPEDDLPRIAARMAEGTLPVEAWGRDGSTRIAVGQLALVDNQINQATATIKLKATFPNAGRALWPNQFVKARLLLTTRKDALVIPAAVVQRGPQGTFAYVTTPEGTVAVRPIRVDALEGDVAIVGAGLSAGERVVVDGQGQLRPGARFSAKPAASGGAPPLGSAGPAGGRR